MPRVPSSLLFTPAARFVFGFEQLEARERFLKALQIHGVGLAIMNELQPVSSAETSFIGYY